MTRKLYSTVEAAELLGLTDARVRQLCREEVLGVKIGGRWLVSAADVVRYRRNRRPAGRPVKGRR